MVHQEGTAIVDGEGKPLRLRGVNLGGWLHWEGWDFSKGADISENKIDAGLAGLVGQDAVDRFHEQMEEKFITEDDIRAIAGDGFNSIRLPVNNAILEDDDWPYVYKDSGWERIDRALEWCETHGVYVIFDLHAAPGGQFGLPPSNPGPGKPKLWRSQENIKRTVALWQATAKRYKDRTIVAGYDLLNEPLPPEENQFVGLYQWLVPAIRRIAPRHQLIIEGTPFSGKFSMFSGPLSQNQAYGFHMYSWLGDNRQKKLDEYREASRAHGVPLWAGEFGDNTYEIIASTVAMYEDLANGVAGGWSFWTWKKVPGKWPALAAITVPARWQAVFDWINDPKKSPRPSAEDALKGMEEFLDAVRLENTHGNERMMEALTGGWRSGSKPLYPLE
ncbi:MAG: cellulase family glycosylhydrolase [Anaerolineales bacterium]|nr:cellulase family glycosylhydrolase [Anaerolineales bacterium]